MIITDNLNVITFLHLEAKSKNSKNIVNNNLFLCIQLILSVSKSQNTQKMYSIVDKFESCLS